LAISFPGALSSTVPSFLAHLLDNSKGTRTSRLWEYIYEMLTQKDVGVTNFLIVSLRNVLDTINMKCQISHDAADGFGLKLNGSLEETEKNTNQLDIWRDSHVWSCWCAFFRSRFNLIDSQALHCTSA
jgi:hypothetical protein